LLLRDGKELEKIFNQLEEIRQDEIHRKLGLYQAYDDELYIGLTYIADENSPLQEYHLFY
jgi:hypothetical protein